MKLYYHKENLFFNRCECFQGRVTLYFKFGETDILDNEVDAEVALSIADNYIKFIQLPKISILRSAVFDLFPWRSAIAHLSNYSEFCYPNSFINRVGYDNIIKFEKELEFLGTRHQSIENVFDAVASIIGVCDVNTYRDEAQIILDNIAREDINDRYPINRYYPFDLKLMFSSIIKDLDSNLPQSLISAKFHNTFAYILLFIIKTISRDLKIDNIVFMGRLFQNKIISNLLLKYLMDYNVNIYYPRSFLLDNLNYSAQKELLCDIFTNPIRS